MRGVVARSAKGRDGSFSSVRTGAEATVPKRDPSSIRSNRPRPFAHETWRRDNVSVTSQDAAPVLEQDVPDYLRPGLKLVIVGINPGIRSGAARRHYAFRGNHFWPLMYNSGLLPIPLTHENDERVLEFDIGLTNLVDRTTRGMEDLTWEEMVAAGDVLRAKMLKYRPKVVCFNGMGIYQAFAGSKKRIELGLQPETLDGILLYVVPSSSGRTAAYQMDAKLSFYKDLRALVDRVSSGAAP